MTEMDSRSGLNVGAWFFALISDRILPRRGSRRHVGCTGSRWWVVIAALVVPGCSNSAVDPNRPQVVPATGVVLYEGRPIGGAEVTFNNEAAGTTGSAKTDESGRFVLSTFGRNDGVVPGPQLVAIRRVDVIDKTPPGVDVSAGGKAIPPEIRWIIPQKYSDAKKSGLTADVAVGGTNDFKFDLK
jgi:hypothetical protein